MKKKLKRIAIITSGGDCSGMNACIRSITKTAIKDGFTVLGFKKGYQGILDNDFILLDSKTVSGKIDRGGTFLGSARCLDFKTKKGLQKGHQNLIDLEVDALIVIGGDGSLTGALKLHELGFRTIGIPASIDNDLHGTDMAIGVDTALNAICTSIDTIRDTASSHQRAFVVEVMGRDCGYLALVSAISAGAEMALIPEMEYDLEKVAKKLVKRYKEGKTNSIIVVAEGASTARNIGWKLKDYITGFDLRETVLGHIQRGGAPSVFDRLLASKLGRTALYAIENKSSGVMVALQNNKYITIPLEEVIKKKKKLSKDLIKLSGLLDVSCYKNELT